MEMWWWWWGENNRNVVVVAVVEKNNRNLVVVEERKQHKCGGGGGGGVKTIELWEFIAGIMLFVCFYLKLILRLSKFRIIVTYTKLKKKTSLKNAT